MLSDLYIQNEEDDAAGKGFLARDIIRFVAVDIILKFLIQLMLMLGLFGPPGEHMNKHVLGILASKLVLLGYMIWLVREKRDAWPATGGATLGKWWAWFAGLAIYAGVFFALPYVGEVNHEWMVRLYRWLGWEYVPTQDVMLYIFSDVLAQPVKLILVFFTAILGPVMEELAFRGIGYDASRKSLGATGAVLWMGLLFGIYHFDLKLLIPLGLLGVVFGIVRALSGTLWSAIFLHCLHNTLALWVMAKGLGRL